MKPKRSFALLISLLAAISLLFPITALAAGTVCQIANGCTGTSTSPAYGKVLIGGANGEYELVASSTFGATGAGSVTSITAGTGLTGGTITTSGTIALDQSIGAVWTAASSTYTQHLSLNTASSTQLGVSGTLWLPSLTSALHLGDANGKTTAYSGTTCTNQFVRSLNGAGVATCNTVSLTSDVTNTLPIANGGTNASSFGTSNGLVAYNGTSLVDFTAFKLTSSLLTVSNASSTLFSAYQAYLGGTATDTISSSGTLTLQDADNSWSGIQSPTHFLTLSESTTTTFTASTTGAYVPVAVATFAGTVKNVQCIASSTASFVGVAPFIGATSMTPSYFVASNTVGTITFTGNDTFTAGEQIGMYVGTTTSDSKQIFTTCTFQVVQTA